MRIAKLMALVLSVIAVSTTGPLAFHDAGVADCAGCHTMHNSQDGAPIDTVNVGGNPYLLKAANSTDACLSCHADYGQFKDGLGYGAGGDFYWLTKTYTWESHGHDAESTGDSHGHNVISPANGILADQILGEAPGGDFDSDYLTCTSCHDPHGNMSFRLLYSSALGPIYPPIDGRYDFDNDAPLAKGNNRRTYPGGDGRGEPETNEAHTVYKSGMSEWCANCHADFHSYQNPNFVHDVGEDLNGLANVYNAYISSDSTSGGSQATAYWGLVPFEDVDVDLETVDTENYTTGPTQNDQVMCVTCHRAHATAFPDIGRWDFGATFIVHDSHPQQDDGGATQEDIDNMYYDYTFVSNQRSLCNKCHVKDAFDGPYEE